MLCASFCDRLESFLSPAFAKGGAGVPWFLLGATAKRPFIQPHGLLLRYVQLPKAAFGVGTNPNPRLGVFRPPEMANWDQSFL